jgi:hypothetical protein
MWPFHGEKIIARVPFRSETVASDGLRRVSHSETEWDNPHALAFSLTLASRLDIARSQTSTDRNVNAGLEFPKTLNSLVQDRARGYIMTVIGSAVCLLCSAALRRGQVAKAAWPVDRPAVYRDRLVRPAVTVPGGLGCGTSCAH